MTLESTRTKYYFGILTNLMATIIIVGIGYITKVIETKKSAYQKLGMTEKEIDVLMEF